MRRLPFILVLFALGLSSSTVVGGCSKSEPKISLVEAKPEEGDEVPSMEEQAIARKEALENAPEPELNADGYVIGSENDPREKMELVWKLGGSQIDSFHKERYDIIRRLQEIKFDDKETQKAYEPLVERLQSYAIGRKPEQLETAAGRLCEMIEAVRVPAEQMMADGLAELEVLDVTFKELEAKEAEGKTVYQSQWDKIEDAKKAASKPVTAGKFLLLGVKSTLQEAFILADYGPRRAQKKLLECLGAINEKPLALPLAQDELEKVLERAKWYRRL